MHDYYLTKSSNNVRDGKLVEQEKKKRERKERKEVNRNYNSKNVVIIRRNSLILNLEQD